jgi:hypothetical protein
MGVRRYNELDLLHPDFRGLVVLFLARCAERRIPVVIVETWRTEEAHAEDIANGRSWITKSKHQHTVLRRFGGLEIKDPASLAVDVAPYDVYRLYGGDKLRWKSDDPVWPKLGELGESVGMKWGGRWEKKDLCHFQAPWA